MEIGMYARVSSLNRTLPSQSQQTEPRWSCNSKKESTRRKK
jgi:hypothetical protein